LGKFKEKEIMPQERLFTIRGKQPAALTHAKIQLSSYDPTHQYLIVEFKVRPAGTALSTDVYGTLSMGENDNIDPSDPDFGDQNQIAWAHSSVQQSVPPAIGESIKFYNDSVIDDKLFAYDLWLHTEDVLITNEVNYMIKIIRYKTDATSGSISSLRQYLVNTA
jgi:hypothetical protein